MKAKDTVMDDLAPAIIAHADLPMGQAIAIEQAEISFKAGIKEVVDWMNSHCDLGHCNPEDVVKEWQAKLKEWGL